MSNTLAEINRKAVEAGSRIKLLSSISWPQTLQEGSEILDALEQGKNPAVPNIPYPQVDYTNEIRTLETLAKSFTADDPLELVTRSNIESYIEAAKLVHAACTTSFTARSVEVFGQPSDPLPGTSLSNLEAAEELLALGHNFEHPYIESLPESTSATAVAAELNELIHRHFNNTSTRSRSGLQPPRVIIVDGLAAKATATSDTIRIRSGTWFNRYEPKQLFAHEVMVHALTARNGLQQPTMKTLGRGSPRTTATQEGLATFSELVTGSIDLKRLLRIALRTIAIDRALNGANFQETYDFFVTHGQGSHESFHSAARIFRGGQPGGIRCIFTKDVVYLAGLMRIHALFRWALANKRIGLVHLLFCGRVAIEDCFLLEGALEAGHIAPPLDLPEWYENIEGLAGQLTFSFIAASLGGRAVADSFNSPDSHKKHTPCHNH
jgi:uncharacterized protein (TIGR02421 family)